MFKQWSWIFFPNLTILKLARNRLTKMTGLNLYKTTPGVVYVDLSVNMISVVDSNIKYLLNLQHLDLHENQISSLEYLHDLASTPEILKNCPKCVEHCFSYLCEDSR